MSKRTYKPDDYALETQAAMKEILISKFDPSNYNQNELTHISYIADAIEKAVLSAKQVTEDKVRAGCAAVADSHLKNINQDREYIEFARPIQQKVVQRLVSIVDRLEAENKRLDGIQELLPEVCHDNQQLKAEKAELLEAYRMVENMLTTYQKKNLVKYEDNKEYKPIKTARAALAPSEPESGGKQ